TEVTCARARVRVRDRRRRTAEGWGETPLSVQWVWPSSVSFEERLEVLKQACLELCHLSVNPGAMGHPIEIGDDFQQRVMPGWLEEFNFRHQKGKEPVPWLAALVCSSVFDLATHDAYGNLHGVPCYTTYTSEFM